MRDITGLSGAWRPFFAFLGLLLLAQTSRATPATAVQARLDADIARDLPVVVHLTVALCDNKNQGIVPVPAALGNGQDPKSNLYWGALYGVKTHLGRKAGWTALKSAPSARDQVLERVVFQTEIRRAGKPVPVYIVADAWDGAHMKTALTTFLDMAAGQEAESVSVTQNDATISLKAGGAAHLVAFVGHNGLMDFSLPAPKRAADAAGPRSVLILACASKPYFTPHLTAASAHPLLLTTGLMAPEAYTLDAAIRAWVGDGSTKSVHEAAAAAYHRYQKCGMKGARRLFWGAD